MPELILSWTLAEVLCDLSTPQPSLLGRAVRETDASGPHQLFNATPGYPSDIIILRTD